MAKQPKVKCPICGEQFYREDEPFVKIKNRYAHKKCFEAQEIAKDEETKEKDLLYSYISKIFNDTANYARINKQISEYLKQGYSYKGMRKTLIYWFDVKHGDLSKTNGGIGIIPYIYQDALTYWRGIWEAQQRNKEAIVESSVIVPTIEIHIPTPQRQPVKKLRKLFTFLEEGEENEE